MLNNLFLRRTTLTGVFVRNFSTSTTYNNTTTNMASPFTRAVVSSMRSLYPELLADKSFDNTGLLLEAPFDPSRRNRNSVLLTIDLTRAVADEAIENKHSIVIAYHPIIFRGLKALTLQNSQQQSLLRLAANGISVYSPHTAVDIVPGGMADWLCDVVAGKMDLSMASSGGSPTKPDTTNAKHPKPTSATSRQTQNSAQTSSLEITYPSPSSSLSYPSTLSHSRKVITPSPISAIEIANNSAASSSVTPSTSSIPSTPRYTTGNTGSGRLIFFNQPQPLSLLLSRIAESTGSPRAISVAVPRRSPAHPLSEILITSVGVCPGSGSSVLSAASPAPDLIVTGEMSHHETLATIERGGCVMTLFHSNSERGYLTAVMKDKIQQKVEMEWERTRNEFKEKGKEWEEVLADEDVKVVVSERDRDPFGMVLFDQN